MCVSDCKGQASGTIKKQKGGWGLDMESCVIGGLGTSIEVVRVGCVAI